MANKASKKQTEKVVTKNSQEEIIEGLFLNSAELKTEIQLEITNLEKIEVIGEKQKTIKEKKEKVITTESNFSLNDNLYIEVHKLNLLQYFSAGCIFPSSYSLQKAFSDPQSINENVLLISNGILSNDIDHILIQINASAIDTTLLSVKNAFGLYCGAIPVSRIIKVFVYDNETKNKIIDDSLIREAGIIPEALIKVGFPTNLSKEYFVDINITGQNLETQLNQFDKILGLISGSRNFNTLTYNQTGKIKSISDHSLIAMQSIDETFATEIVNSGHTYNYYNWLFTKSCPNDRPLLKWLFNRVYNNTNFTDLDTIEFESLCNKTKSFPGEEKQVKEIFSALKKSLEKKKALINILQLQSNNSLALYVFAYLRNFGTNQNPELPRVELSSSAVNKYSEYAFSTLNFFFGYKRLRNSEDRIIINDEALKNTIRIPTKPNIKFELTTEFDYHIIDSVFNLVFGIKANELSQYKNISPEQDASSIVIEGYNCFSSIIYGKFYYRIIKSDIEEQLKNLPNEITIFSEFGIVCHRLGLKRNLIGLDELIGNPKSILRFVYYSKKELIDSIRANKIDAEEIKHRIALSQKHNEL